MMKTNELTGAALDWAVAKCEGEEVSMVKGQLETRWTDNGWKPSTDWAQGGPIIEREEIGLEFMDNFDGWSASLVLEHSQDRDNYTDSQDRDSYTVTQDSFAGYGPTPLIAAMRCYVASKLGDEVDIPEELT